MKVVMLAAGLGSRLGQTSAEIGPKVLMQFGGKSLLERHIDICQGAGNQRVSAWCRFPT